MRKIKAWLKDNTPVFGAIKDVMTIVAAPAALVTFVIGIISYNEGVNTEKAKFLFEVRKDYAELVRMIQDPKVSMDVKWFFIFQHLETMWYLQRLGKLDDEFWRSISRDTCNAFKTYGSPYWDKNKKQYSEKFVQFVEDARKSC